ncbi:MAG: penicillin acylase family protein [Calditrichaeota bacterium]|nr:MAG: penicillin acylase family protein [Calditrichota bacterium]
MRIRTIVLSGIVLLALFAGLVFLFVYHQFQQLKPDYSGSGTVDGLSAPVTIRLDSLGVAHLSANSEKDLITAEGYWVASERLWQMELMRRVGAGRLTEVFGDTALKADRLFRTLALDSLCRTWVDQLSPQSQQWLTWYAQGVNAYIEACRGNYPLEFQILNIKPEPWEPAHSLLIGRVMAWILNFSWKGDFLYWQLSQRLGSGLLRELWPRWPNSQPSILSYGQARSAPTLTLLEMDEAFRALLDLGHGGWGSNSWVVSGKFTHSGKPFLANDPHLELSNPPIWFALQLSCPAYSASGVVIPGLPGITIGRNQAIAWGFTNGMVDDCDFFLEQIDTTRGTYRQDGKTHPLKSRLVQLRGKKRRLRFRVWETKHGPVFNLNLPEGEPNQAVALHWTGRMFSDEMLTFWKLIRAGNWEEFREALRSYRVPAQNVVYADTAGNIGYQLAGGIPFRRDKNGLLPRDGTSSREAWGPFVPFESLPQLFNPQRGYIVTANNRIQPEPPYYISELWEPPFRAERIKQLLETLPRPLTLEQMRAIQADIVNLPGLRLAHQIVQNVRAEDIADLTKQADDILWMLDNWDGKMEAARVEPAILEVTQWFLIKNIFQDEMGPTLFRWFTRMPNFYVRIFYQVIADPQSAWFDNQQTTNTVEGSRDIFVQSLRDAIGYLKSRLGPSLYQWQWGALHQFTYAHPMGSVALFRRLLNRGPYPVPGNVATVNVASYRYEKPFQLFAGPSMRMIVDWAHPERLYLHWPGGNSGNPFSPFYDNVLGAWLQVKIIPIFVNKPLQTAYKITLKGAE